MSRSAAFLATPAGLASLLALGCASGPPAAAPAAPAPSEIEATVRGFAVRAIVLGAGPETVLFVHGWCGNARFWSESQEALAPFARAVAIDLPGHGRSEAPHVN